MQLINVILFTSCIIINHIVNESHKLNLTRFMFEHENTHFIGVLIFCYISNRKKLLYA